MKCVLISIRPEWCEKIASGVKTVEVRKTKPKLEPPFKVYIYCTSGPPYLNSHNGYCYLEDRDVLGFRGPGLYCRLNHGVIGEFVCKRITEIKPFGFDDIQEFEKQTCLKSADIVRYLNGFYGYGWRISDLKIYAKPKELGEFAKPDKCPYNIKGECMYTRHCYRAGQTKRCGDCVEKPPQSWCYVEEVTT